MDGKLVFAVNGQRFELNKIDPSTTLLEFLRTQTKFKSAKLGCGEGGCGACVVLLSTYDSVTEQVKEFSISSCLTLLCSINFCAVTTSEGLGNTKDGFHSIHKRIAGFHASQCGFCTPGMCMSLFSSLVNADKKSNRPEPAEGFSRLTKSEAVGAISGNLCRCTGYRPISDVCKSFAADVDLEDLGLNTFWEKGASDAKALRLPKHSPDAVCTFPDFLKSEIQSSLSVVDNSNGLGLPDSNWYRPCSFDDLYTLLNYKSSAESHVKMVASNTGSGIYKDNDQYNKFIDLKGIAELSFVQRNSQGILFGAAVSIAQAIEALREEKGSTVNLEQRLVFSRIADHMGQVANPFVRNTASLGGNLIMAQRNQFPSDIATILLAVGTIVSLQMPSERVSITLEEFLGQPPCDNKTILVNILIPFQNFTNKSYFRTNGLSFESTKESSIMFETYRAAPRSLGNAVAYLNSAFLAQVTRDKTSGDTILQNLQLAFGAYGCEHAIRAREVENFLAGKALNASVLLEAVKLIKKIIVPTKGTPHSGYRSSLAVAFLFRFLQPLSKALAEPQNIVHTSVSKGASSSVYGNGNLNGCANDSSLKASNSEQLDQVSHHDIVSSSNQMIEISKVYNPVGQPVKKSGAEIQASGEAVYVDDIPTPKDCVYGAFVYSTESLASIKGIKLESSEKVIKYININDIPEAGKNIGVNFMFGSEPLFADSVTVSVGQPLGVVIAETQKLANIAAKQAKVYYSTENLEPPILSVEDAVRRSSLFEIPPHFQPKKVGDLSKGMEEAEHKITSAEVFIGSQYHFYMETQSALAIPDEDNCMVVYSSTQMPEFAHGVIAKCLGIPEHNVRVITRRVGGGFGGKGLKSIPVATACALAAFNLQRPVKMYLDRRTDMIMCGGRHPMKVKYSVGFKSDGTITALHVDLLINAGITEDISPLLPDAVIASLKKYNWGVFSFDIKLCKTNLPTKGAMRAPGDVQGSFIAEAIIEHVASFLSIDTNSIRKKNLHNFESLKLYYEDMAGESPEYTLISMVDELNSSANLLSRLENVQNFNSHNKWRKRGISLVPCVYRVLLLTKPGRVSILNDGSVVVEVGGIEIGQGLWTKVKQMAAYGLARLLDNGNRDILDRVRVVQADTLSLIQGGYTGGSTTSESSCEAIRLCCDVLVDRLRSLKERLGKEKGLISWDSLISQASLESVNLSASSYFVPDNASTGYLNYGAAISEVELDVLTGAITIMRSDLIYDCGQSLNPAVDLGQVEGAFVQGIGFFMYEEHVENSDGLVVSDGTWTYKIPTVDTIPKQLNVKIFNSGHHEKRVLSSKASGEPPLVLAASVHCATREAIRSARREFSVIEPSGSPSIFQMNVPATMPVIKELCGLDIVEKHLESLVSTQQLVEA